MLVQRRADGFRLVRQNDHALLAARLAQEWIGTDPAPSPVPFRAVTAIALHDLAWAAVDAEPEWDDEAKRPRAFDAVPDEYREGLYAAGLDLVEDVDAYAALIGSFHYARFLPEDSSFGRAEARRRERLLAALPRAHTAAADLDAHRALLRHLDFLSLYLLLGDPGGLDTPDWLAADPVGRTAPGSPLALARPDAATVTVRPFPFRRPFTVGARARDVPADAASADALRDAWRRSSPHDVVVSLSPG